jgi:hypothetical protein
MRFRQYAPFFGPDELDTLTAAFESTWQELSSSGIDLSGENEIAQLKRKLMQRILVSATAGGVRDVETLKQQSLRSLAGNLRASSQPIDASEAA